VDWRPGDRWAYITGSPADVGSAFGVTVHDYRGTDGHVFYAAPQDPQVPPPVRGEVTEVGRILSSAPLRTLRPLPFPRDVPEKGLTPTTLKKTYNATPLKVDGKGQTIVFFEFGKGLQKDYDLYAKQFKLPPLKPKIMGKEPDEADGETPMDLQIAHGIAPAAQKVIIYLPNPLGNRDWAKAMEAADSKYPGAVWSLSLGWGCDMIFNAAVLAPLQGAVQKAESHGTSVFISAGDSGGYECKAPGQPQPGMSEWFAPPLEGDIGLNSLSSIPEVTSVGGTTLSTDDSGAWANEVGWAEYPTGIGTGGGVSNLYPRPDWQRDVPLAPDLTFNHQGVPDPASKRLTPDISAVADSSTGAAFFMDGDGYMGGGTSQSAPIWAALTVLMNQYLTEHDGHPIGAINPLLYRAATGAKPAFHDVTVGGNIAYNSGTGFDLATGLGTPDTANLVDNILDIQKAGG
jgi:kumamolisin